MGIRRRGRELALQVLYQVEISGDASPAGLEFAFQHVAGSAKAKEFARRLALGVTMHRTEIDRAIEESSENWRLNRIAKVDLIILRVATYELLYCPDIPLNVSIDEALEVGKRYGGDDSRLFINGILDQVARATGVKQLSKTV